MGDAARAKRTVPVLYVVFSPKVRYVPLKRDLQSTQEKGEGEGGGRPTNFATF